MNPTAWASSGLADRAISERSTVRCRTVEPSWSPLPFLMPSRSPRRLMSTRCDGRARRRLSRGTRLCPPARIFASSPCSARRATASSTEPARWYSNGGGFTPPLYHTSGWWCRGSDHHLTHREHFEELDVPRVIGALQEDIGPDAVARGEEHAGENVGWEPAL